MSAQDKPDTEVASENVPASEENPAEGELEIHELDHVSGGIEIASRVGGGTRAIVLGNGGLVAGIGYGGVVGLGYGGPKSGDGSV
jgi:hypothetical protein